MIAPFFENLSNKYAGRGRFVKVDVDEAQEIAQSCGISAMPTFQFYLNGSRVAEIRGADPNNLENTIKQHAPSSADVSFAGGGHTLGSSSSVPPKVNWDSVAANDEISTRREAMAKAAAERATVVPASAPAVETGKAVTKEPVAAVASVEDTKVTPVAASEATASGGEASSSAAAAAVETQNDARLRVDERLLNQLQEMGFPTVRAEKSLILTGNKGLESAMEWCFEHADDADIDEPLVIVDGGGVGSLSAEERKKRGEEALRKARARREEMDKAEAVEREKNRVRSGKEITEAKREHEEQQRKRAIEQKRQEKREALLAKKRIKDLVEADRAARREKYAKRGGASEAAAPAAVEKRAAPVAVSGGKLQLRLPDGGRLELHFEAEATLGDVVARLASQRPELNGGTLRLSQPYPRRTFGADEYSKTLGELQLVPRGVLNVGL